VRVERHPAAQADRRGLFGADGQGDRDGPDGPAGQVHALHDTLVVVVTEETLQRGDAAHGQQFQVGRHPRIDGDRRQATCLRQQGGALGLGGQTDGVGSGDGCGHG